MIEDDGNHTVVSSTKEGRVANAIPQGNSAPGAQH